MHSTLSILTLTFTCTRLPVDLSYVHMLSTLFRLIITFTDTRLPPDLSKRSHALDSL